MAKKRSTNLDAIPFPPPQSRHVQIVAVSSKDGYWGVAGLIGLKGYFTMCPQDPEDYPAGYEAGEFVADTPQGRRRCFFYAVRLRPVEEGSLYVGSAV
jgi:hypothetical protein